MTNREVIEILKLMLNEKKSKLRITKTLTVEKNMKNNTEVL